ncbi:hypothetical protein NDU88_003040 [Pleurodeles waltl]|uniref:Uncharacterized protein n=1 Tax=Pleurodeles waltl TaxID=8319 RepID=A0AAV7MZ22_PLEWA|nr:hypothetical protein NDU88_003040 [Pleurodeles waltl]
MLEHASSGQTGGTLDMERQCLEKKESKALDGGSHIGDICRRSLRVATENQQTLVHCLINFHSYDTGPWWTTGVLGADDGGFEGDPEYAVGILYRPLSTKGTPGAPAHDQVDMSPFSPGPVAR